jgi:hypothetical protein
LGESERVNQAVATLCTEEKKSIEEKVAEVRCSIKIMLALQTLPYCLQAVIITTLISPLY